MSKRTTQILDRAEFTKGAEPTGDFALAKGGEIAGAMLKGRDALREFLIAEKVDEESIEKAVEETGASEISFPFTLSTRAPDRQGDSIDQSGWDLANYRKNPVVLWAHDYESLPVARASAIYVAGDKLRAVDRFSDDHELARTVAALYQKGFLSAVSVGFRPKKWAWNEERGGMAADFFECELLEHSAVPVPAHQDALIEARSLGMSIGPVLKWAEAIVERSDSGLFLPTDMLKGAIASASTRVVVDFGNRKAIKVETIEPATNIEQVEPTEVPIEVAMSRVAKAGFAVVAVDVLADLNAKATAPKVEPVVESKAADPAPTPAEPVVETKANDTISALLANPAELRALLREELSSSMTKTFADLNTKLTGRLD